MSAHDRVEAIHPLSPSQTGMWLQSQSNQSSALFVEQAAWCFEGPLDRNALSRALQFVVDRHAALRSAIVSKDREPVRVVLRAMPVVILDAHAPRGREDEALAALMAQERARGFRLNRPPLIRFALLHVGDDRTWLVLSFHHVIIDGWSLVVLWTEAQRFYAAEITGKTISWPSAPDDREFAAWLNARSPEASEAFWRSRLSGFSAPNRLAAAPLEGGLGPFDAAEEIEHLMSRHAGAALSAVAQVCRVSPAVVLEVLWAIVIAGRTRTMDVAFAATVSGRPGHVQDIERMVGCFINTVPIRVRFDEGVTIRESVIHHQQQRAEQAEFEYCSAGQIHDWSGVRTGLSLCQSLMVYENLPAASATSDESFVANAPHTGHARTHGARTSYPLTMVISPGVEPHVRVIYHVARFSEQAARGFATELERLVILCDVSIDAPVQQLCGSIAFVPVSMDAQAARAAFVAPRTRIEHQLADIWGRLFQRDDLSVLDDFFSLGGHSLLAIRMGAAVRAALGVDLPLDALLTGRTIETLAHACTASSSGDDEALIAIATGGSEMPIVCVHPLGGHVLCYAALGRQLGSRHPVWGLQAKGLKRGESVAATWDEIIDHHWALLLDVHARRTGTRERVDDVTLVGYSYGGYITMELAARAYRLGATRVPVILLDTPHLSVVPETMRHPSAATLLHALFGAALGLDQDVLESMPEDAVLRHVYDSAVRQHVLPPDASLDQLARALSVARAHSRLEPPSTRYPFAASLLRAREQPDRVSALPDLGWRDYAAGVAVEWVEGRHETMLDVQHVETLAARIVVLLAR